MSSSVLREREQALRQQIEENERIQREMREQAERLERERQNEYAELQQEQKRMLAEMRRKEEEQRTTMEGLERRYREKEESLHLKLQLLQRNITLNVWPTAEQWARAREMLVPGERKIHCAIAGNSGSGKSSLVNAFRGLYNKDPQAAEIGVTETTEKITSYPDLSPVAPHNSIVWYDCPGAGTLSIPGPEYFNAQGLFIFDMVIVVIDTRVTTQDIAILQQCEYFKIPSLIVRSKANQHILNIMHEELGYSSDDSDAEEAEDYNMLLGMAKSILINNTMDSVRENLEDGQLSSDQRVYIVSADCVRSLILLERQGKKIKKPEMIINEQELIEDLVIAISETHSN
ncbi:interferon-inducible GTPase-domain-containing protein [Kalaharituber pfeilii]|nr:interferon-inducible GTPase-domain-containing protein [Kalaharituber pfeilii]